MLKLVSTTARSESSASLVERRAASAMTGRALAAVDDPSADRIMAASFWRPRRATSAVAAVVRLADRRGVAARIG